MSTDIGGGIIIIRRNLTKQAIPEVAPSVKVWRMGWKIEPTDNERAQLLRLSSIILEPIRIRVDKSVHILSGLRPRGLNTYIGGAKNSEHIFGRAADIEVEGYTPMQLAVLITEIGVPFNQLIVEFDEWVHVSVAEEGAVPKREVLTARHISGKTVYLPGIVPKAAA
jgi:zinc D-Ala-D-Ala carboxypeptidase